MKPLPDILFIMVDQWNAECFSALGHPDVKTPHLDRLIAEGVTFRNHFSVSPICQPARVSFLTGQYPHTHGVETNDSGANVISRNEPLPHYLREKAGYRTGAFGKLHLGQFQREAGFDSVKCCCDPIDGENDYLKFLSERGLLAQYQKETHPTAEQRRNYWHGTSVLPVAESVEHWTVDRTIEFIDQSSEPYFAWCSFERPHAPHTPPADIPFKYHPEKLHIPAWNMLDFETKVHHARPGVENLWKAWVSGEERLREALADYYSLISLIDAEIGRLLQHLEECGRIENTMVIFTADHGDFAGTHGMLGKNSSHYDAVIRSPLIMWSPGRWDVNMLFELVESIDLYPTLCQELKLPTPATVQGVEFTQALRDPNYFIGKEFIFCEKNFTRTVRSRTYKLTRFITERRHGELFDLVHDPEEVENLYFKSEGAAIRQQLLEALVDHDVIHSQPACCSRDWEAPPWEIRFHHELMRK